MQNDQEPKTHEEQIRSLYTDERTQNRIKEHLTNESDIITEQDIANISTGIVHPEKDVVTDIKESDSEDTEATEDEVLEKTKVRDNEDPGIETPWNILG